MDNESSRESMRTDEKNRHAFQRSGLVSTYNQ